MKDTTDTYPTPVRLEIDPIDFGAGLVLPLPGGRSIYCFDEQPAGPSADKLAQIMSVLKRYGHRAIVGDFAALSRAALEELGV